LIPSDGTVLTDGFRELDFRTKTISPMIDLGKKDAETIVGLGAGAAFDALN